MFESMTFEALMQRMLARVGSGIDKREGSIIYDALAPAAVELAIMYMELDMFLNEAFADTASREYLIRRAAERGLVPEEATNGIFKVTVSPSTLDVVGERFNCGEYNYVILSKISDGIFRAQCETAGAAPNSVFGRLIPIDYIQGLQTAYLSEIIIPGEDEEDTEVFRQRYMDSLQSQAFGGNVADYRQKVLALDGVGGVKVYRAEDWNGAGTVKLVVQDSDFGVPSAAFVNELQTEIDPVMNSGEGIGLAPIGHQVTVTAVSKTAIAVTATITYSTGYTYADIKSDILAVIAGYFEELNKSWDDLSAITVFLMQIGARLLNITGITDVTALKIDGSAANKVLGANNILDLTNSTFNGDALGGE